LELDIELLKRGYGYFNDKLSGYLCDVSYNFTYKFSIYVTLDKFTGLPNYIYKFVGLYDMCGLLNTMVCDQSSSILSHYKLPYNNMLLQHYDNLKLYRRKLHHRYKNDIFTGRFILHGNRERSLRGYKNAVNYLQCRYNTELSTAYMHCGYNLVSLYGINSMQLCCGNLMYGRYLLTFSTLNTMLSSCRLCCGLYDWDNIAGVYSNILEQAPKHGVVINRVHKTVYKNTHGKSGKYSASLRPLNKNTGLRYMLRYYKLAWRFSHGRTYNDKYIDILYTIVLRPEYSLGVLYGE